MKNKWNLLYLALGAILLFSLFAVPQIAQSVIGKTKGQIVTVETDG